METVDNLLEKYSFYQEIRDHLVSIEPATIDSTVQFLTTNINQHQLDVQAIYKMIADVCEINIIHHDEYWKIFDKIYQINQNKPVISNSDYILHVLFANKYNIRIRNVGKYSDGEFESYESDPIMKCIIHDDINALKDIIELSNSEFDFDQIKFDRNLIENSCKFGALKCFKFLRSNNIKITKECLDSSICGRNNSIIDECLSFFKPDERTMRMCLKCSNLDMVVSFHEKYGIEIPIHSAIKHLNLPAFIYLMQSATTFDSFLIDSVSFGIPSLIKDILSLGANIEATDTNGETALIKSIANNYLTIHSKLIEYGANIDAKNRTGETSLFYPLKSNDTTLIAKLIKCGANIEARNRNGVTPLIQAARFSNTEVIKLLIESGANIESRDNDGETPLISASRYSRKDVVAFLVEKGANIEVQSNDGETPLIYAAEKDEINIATLLIKHGANIEVADEMGNRPLHYAARYGSHDVLEKLIECGAEVDARNKKGETPLFGGSANHNFRCCEILINHGADIEAKDNNGESIIDIKETIDILELFK